MGAGGGGGRGGANLLHELLSGIRHLLRELLPARRPPSLHLGCSAYRGFSGGSGGTDAGFAEGEEEEEEETDAPRGTRATPFRCALPLNGPLNAVIASILKNMFRFELKK